MNIIQKLKGILKNLIGKLYRKYSLSIWRRFYRLPIRDIGFMVSWKEYLPYHFVKKKVSYRIAYSIDEDNRIVYVLMIAKREGFYEILKRRCS